MQHLAAFHESIDPAGALVNIAAVNDDTVFTSGDDLRVPLDLPFLIGEAAALEATAALQARVESPSLRRIANLDVSPFDTGLVIDSGQKVAMHPMNPVPLRGDEAVNFLINSNPVAATSQYGLVWFGDGPQTPVTGDIFTVRATMSLTAVLGAWTNGGITFAQDLPVGNYDVVGMRVIEATTVAARLNFVGGAWRPGVAALGTDEGIDNYFARYGRMGLLGTFHTNTPPTIDILAAAGAITPVVYIDLIARG